MKQRWSTSSRLLKIKRHTNFLVLQNYKFPSISNNIRLQDQKLIQINILGKSHVNFNASWSTYMSEALTGNLMTLSDFKVIQYVALVQGHSECCRSILNWQFSTKNIKPCKYATFSI